MGGVAGVGAGHLKANNFVQSFQNPFGDFMNQTVKSLDDAGKAGSLTYDQAKAALDEFNQNWTSFDQAANQFKQMGGDFAKVVKQAYDPNGDFMKTVNWVRPWLEGQVDSRKPADNGQPDNNVKDATTPPDPTKPAGTGGQTAQDAARTAAANQKKKSLAAPGFISTILGGSQGNATTQKPTLLGY
jgi:hypothetical protein